MSFQRLTAGGGPVIDGGNATNGAVYIIQNVMYPVPPGNIADVLLHNQSFSVMKQLVQKAGLQDFFKGIRCSILSINCHGRVLRLL